jgi:predicted acyl esterase
MQIIPILSRKRTSYWARRYVSQAIESSIVRQRQCLPGHRIMVQVQSSWFPLYDRNPQTFVPNIMFARPGDYHKATQRIWHAAGKMSAVELPVIGQN